MACRSDALWKEPFLLAVAYESSANKKIASDIIRELLTASQTANQEDQARDVLLAAECLIEAKPLSIEAALETQTANQLIQSYEEAQRSYKFKVCVEIERLMRRWLLSLPKEAYRPPLLNVLHGAIIDTTRVAHQRATLTLLTMIAQQLDMCPTFVFNRLIPPLLALASLPAVGDYPTFFYRPCFS